MLIAQDDDDDVTRGCGRTRRIAVIIPLVQLQQLLLLLCCYYTADATLVGNAAILISKWRVTGASSVTNDELESSSAGRVKPFIQNVSTLAGGQIC
jgi:hypothetical protein